MSVKIPLIAGVISLDDFSLIAPANAQVNEVYSSLGSNSRPSPGLEPEDIKFSDITKQKTCCHRFIGWNNRVLKRGYDIA